MAGERSTSEMGQGLVEVRKLSAAELFVDLPVASGVDLEVFSPLIGQIPFIEAQQKVRSRYLDLLNMRKSLGVDGIAEINSEMAIAILDDSCFESVKQEILQEGQTLEVAVHEMGHGIVADALRWKVKSMTVVPASSYLGLTESVPRTGLSMDDWAVEAAAISYGGAIAAFIMGHEVKGHGSDMASAKAKARIALANPNSRYSSCEQLLSAAGRLAHSALRSKERLLTSEAKRLVYKKTVV